jgi:hypothetical protein
MIAACTFFPSCSNISAKGATTVRPISINDDIVGDRFEVGSGERQSRQSRSGALSLILGYFQINGSSVISGISIRRPACSVFLNPDQPAKDISGNINSEGRKLFLFEAAGLKYCTMIFTL